MKHLDWYMTMKKTSDKRNAKYYASWQLSHVKTCYFGVTCSADVGGLLNIRGLDNTPWAALA